MADVTKLNKPWLIAAWPGMGHVAVSAGYYLIAKLGMHLFAELQALELFDIEHVEVKDGIVRPSRLPRSRFFAWHNPNGDHDLVIFIGEAQPPTGKFAFCRRLIEYSRELGVDRVFTFAAMGTQMHPGHDSRVFGVATDENTLTELKRYRLEIVKDGQIGGLNGVLLGAAAERSLQGACLLGEIPHIFAQFPFPKASLAVLEVFMKISGIELDLTELSAQAREMEERLGEILGQMEQAIAQQQQQPGAEIEEEGAESETFEPEGIRPEDEKRLEELFTRARQDRSVAYELKRELDRLGVYGEYEDRFLDLFKKPE